MQLQRVKQGSIVPHHAAAIALLQTLKGRWLLQFEQPLPSRGHWLGQSLIPQLVMGVQDGIGLLPDRRPLRLPQIAAPTLGLKLSSLV